MKYYDNTRVSSYKTCPRLYYLRHVRHLVPEGTAIALSFGLAWHEAMDVVWAMLNAGKTPDETLKPALARWKDSWEESGMEFQPDMSTQEKYGFRTPGVAAEMLYNYMVARRDFIQEVELIAIEPPFAVDLYEDDEEDIKYIGRLDKVVKHREYGKIIIEHKTSSAYAKVGGFRSDYIGSWSPNSQIDGYLHAGHMLYGDIAGVWIDAALVHKTVHNQFRFIPIDRQFEQLDVWLHETRDWIKRIEDEAAGQAGSPYGGYPKNTGSCYVYGGCAYRDICKFVSKPSDKLDDFSGYKISKWEPFDILKIEQLGLEPEGEK